MEKGFVRDEGVAGFAGASFVGAGPEAGAGVLAAFLIALIAAAPAADAFTLKFFAFTPPRGFNTPGLELDDRAGDVQS